MPEESEPTPAMIAAGVEVYSSPGLHETYEEVVARIYRSMRAVSVERLRDVVDTLNKSSRDGDEQVLYPRVGGAIEVFDVRYVFGVPNARAR